jgi:hypothetical protein
MWGISISFGRLEQRDSAGSRHIRGGKDSMASSFDDKLSKLFTDFNDTSGVRDRAQQQEQREIQEFLSAFRGVAQNVIIPRFERVEQNTAAQASSYSFEWNDEIQAKQRVILTAVGESTRISLAYTANFHKKKVEVLNLEPGSVPIFFSIDQLTDDAVENQVMLFVKRILFPG